MSRGGRQPLGGTTSAGSSANLSTWRVSRPMYGWPGPRRSDLAITTSPACQSRARRGCTRPVRPRAAGCPPVRRPRPPGPPPGLLAPFHQIGAASRRRVRPAMGPSAMTWTKRRHAPSVLASVIATPSAESSTATRTFHHLVSHGVLPPARCCDTQRSRTFSVRSASDSSSWTFASAMSSPGVQRSSMARGRRRVRAASASTDRSAACPRPTCPRCRTRRSC
jgi:hypothetical protein